MSPRASLRLALLLVLTAAALGGSLFGAGCSTNGATPCTGSSCNGADAGPPDACPTNAPTPLAVCAVSPLVTCSYNGAICSGGVAYYCSGYHWFAQAQVCGSSGPECPSVVPFQGASCSDYPFDFQCPYGSLCADASDALAVCNQGVWQVTGADCIQPPPGSGTSPLCLPPGSPASPQACDPDLSQGADAGPACPSPAPVEAGAEAGLDSGSNGPPACRVVPGHDGGAAPACAIGGTNAGGAPCTSGSECAPGFECVGGPGNGVCRAYCCANICAGGASDDAGTEVDSGAAPFFCDIEPMAGSPSTAVPVCVQSAPCALLQPCTDPLQTCAPVDPVGTTACIAPGSQDVGQSCEEAHCKAGLACWGTFPTRTCEQLCDATHTCPGATSCQTNFTVFAGSGTGICQ
jgi:hypothetical protein